MTAPRSRPRDARVVQLRPLAVYDVRVTLRDIDPPIWRLLRITSIISLDRLHRVLQKAMGWQNAHLHEFVVGGRRYGIPESDEPEYQVEKEWLVILQEAAPGVGARFQYLYDFGDGWMHDMVVERVEIPKRSVRYPVCLGGARRCPPEDCGGVSGYEKLVAILGDPDHPEHAERRTWVGRRFDPEAFDRAAINLKLRLLG